MAVEDKNCFIDKTIDNQLYTILEKMVEKGYAVDIPTRDCFNGLTLDGQLYWVYSSLKRDLWTPSEISTIFWYDAADVTTITATGNQVTQMLDKSGNNYTLTRASGQVGPNTGTRTLNGLNVLEWTGNNCLENLSFAYNQASTALNVAMVVQIDSPAGTQYFVLAGTSTTATGTRMSTRWLNNSFQVLGGSGGGNIQFLSGVTSPAGQPYLLLPRYNASNSSWRVNGTQTNTGSVGTNAYSILQIGHNEVETSDLDGFVAELVAFANPTNQEIMEGYLAWKWGMESQLPVGHPYKNFPPKV
jgi:hypothetical protein